MDAKVIGWKGVEEEDIFMVVTETEERLSWQWRGQVVTTFTTWSALWLEEGQADLIYYYIIKCEVSSTTYEVF